MSDDIKKQEDTVVHFIPNSQWAAEMERQESNAEMEKAFADRNGNEPLPEGPVFREVSRRKVAQSFGDAFELIGGTATLASWANENQTEFFKLFAKLLPSAASNDLGESNERVVKHILPPTELDR